MQPTTHNIIQDGGTPIRLWTKGVPVDPKAHDQLIKSSKMNETSRSICSGAILSVKRSSRTTTGKFRKISSSRENRRTQLRSRDARWLKACNKSSPRNHRNAEPARERAIIINRGKRPHSRQGKHPAHHRAGNKRDHRRHFTNDQSITK